MSKKDSKKLIESQLQVKDAIIKEFGFTEKKVSQSWLDIIDADPDPENPDHWEYLLSSKEHNCYINLKFFPRITIEPRHTTSYNMGVINYKKGMKPEDIVAYVHNILD